MMQKKIFQKSRFSQILICGIIAMAYSSCTIQNNLGEGEIYFEDHKVDFIEHKNDLLTVTDVSADELLYLTKLKPNRKTLMFRLNMRLNTFVPRKFLERSQLRIDKRCARINKKRYDKETRKNKRHKDPKECSGLWPWLAYTVGESPVLLDTALVNKGARQMEIYLRKNGYFNAEVRGEWQLNTEKSLFWKEGKKSNVTYHVELKDLYTIKNVEWSTEDANILKQIPKLKEKCLVKSGERFRVDNLDAERGRITLKLSNEGFYEFIPDYIIYQLDTVTSPKEVNVKLTVLNQKALDGYGNFTGKTLPHRKFYIGNISFNTSFDPLNPNETPTDTVEFKGLDIYSVGLSCVKPVILDRRVEVKETQLYQQRYLDETYKRFTQLGVFKTVNIQLTPRNDAKTGQALLDVKVLLAPNKKQALSFDPRMTNRAGNMGIYGNFIYKHRNVFRGAESFEFKTVVGAEASQLLGGASASTSTGDQIVQRAFQLNTFEIGPELNLILPRLFPRDLAKTSRSNDPKTTLHAGLNYQRRPDYTRTLSQVSFGWTFIENPETVSSFDIQWAELSLIKIDRSFAFDQWLGSLNDSYLANSYQDHLILASRLGYTVNTQKDGNQPRSFYYRGNILEGAGNLLRAIYQRLPNVSTDSLGSYEINNIRFAQYVKSDHDVRYYTQSDDRNKFAFRAFVGVGIPLKNLSSLPFEKSYFSGGANGLRAWQARTLGPGTFRDTTVVRSFNNIGDIKLEFNAEYRFKITHMVQAAFFVDAGNIWLANVDNSRPGAEFNKSRFLKEFAVGAGAGLRLDFDFFIVRMDVGIPLRDPLKIDGEKWLWQGKDEYNAFLSNVNNTPSTFKLQPVLNLGLGFPF
ncbi:MAG: BamA/TamA family outer membrane protein [Flavobacteriales bacterium]|nr:BamA/TamA family outer membrane protein [Flavobacteriales bacterium]MDP4817373.1 BamA/TamA family outer membrane protein [Flavobacteriales bacterium]